MFVNKYLSKFIAFEILFLIVISLCIYLDLIPQVSPVESGFHDDRNYLDPNFTIPRSELWSNNFIFYKIIILFNHSPFLIRGFNLLLIALIASKLTDLHKENKILVNLLLVSLVFSTYVISKEYLILYLVFTLLSILDENKFNFKNVFLVIIFSVILFFLRTIFALIILSLFIYKANNRLKLILVTLVFFYSAFFYDDLLLFYQNNVIRSIELYFEGRNYGLNSESGSLSSTYSGSIFYSIFQLFFLPIIGKFNYLYNSFIFFPILNIIAIPALAKVFFKRKNSFVLFSIILMIILIAINFGSNYRYKISFTVMLIIGLMKLDFKINNISNFLILLWVIFTLILIPIRF